MNMSELWSYAPQADSRAVLRGKAWRITVLTDRLIRLEYDETGAFRDSATQLALNRSFPVPAFTVAESGKALTVETEFLRLTYDRNPFSPEGLSVMLKGQFGAYTSVWHFGEPDPRNRNLGGTARTLDEADGEIPLEDGLFSLHGWTVLEDSGSMTLEEDGRLTPPDSGETDLYFFGYGRDYRAALRDYFRLSGPPPVLPRFALGNWWSRYYRYSQQEYQDLMLRFRREEIPLSVAVLDMNWHRTDHDPKLGTGWTGYSWDRSMFPEPEKLLSWLHEQGLRVTLNDHPADGLRPGEDFYPALARKLGEDPASGRSFPFDAADEAFLTAFRETVLVPLERMGVDFWWIDWQQQGGSSVPGMNPLFVLNHTRFLHALEAGLPPLILSRYAGPGSHRYPAGFSGDTCATWDSLAFQPFFTAVSANIGYGWWSHDIGGHMHGKKDPELTLRWVQFGVFSPVLRLHSSCNIFMEKEPWAFPHEIAEGMKAALRLRHRLIPWLYTQSLLARESGSLLFRPLYHDDPENRESYTARGEYCFGQELIAAPVTRPADPLTGLAETDVFLPRGRWTDFFTGRRYQGGYGMKQYRRLTETPVFVREGSILPLDAARVPENGAPLPETILLRVFPGADTEAELLEDNGLLPEHPDYRQVRTRFLLKEDQGLTLEILPPEGCLELLPRNRQYLVELNGCGEVPPDAPSLPCEASYDPERRALTLIPRGAVSEGLTLRWNLKPVLPPIDLCAELRKLLFPAGISFDLKQDILSLAESVPPGTVLLAALRRLDLPESLFGAILELCCAE